MDLGDVIRAGLPNTNTKADVVELCQRELAHMQDGAQDHVLHIRYLRQLQMQTCDGVIAGLAPGTTTCPGKRVSVGIAYFAAGTDDGIFVGGAACHPDDIWNRDVGKVVAILNACWMSKPLAAALLLQRAPWSGGIINEKRLRHRKMGYPWAELQRHRIPRLAWPAVIMAIRCAVNHKLSSEPTVDAEPFTITASNARVGLSGSAQAATISELLAHQLVDKYCTLPVHLPLTEEQRAAREHANRVLAGGVRTEPVGTGDG